MAFGVQQSLSKYKSFLSSISQKPKRGTLQTVSLEPASTPHDILPEARARRTMNLSIIEGMPSMFFINLTQGSVLTGFALFCGANPFELGLLSSVPLFGQVLSPFIAWWAGRLGRRKFLAFWLAFIGRGLWILAAMLPMIAPPQFRASLLILIVALSSILMAGNGTLWTAWMGDIVPSKERGRYFGLRGGVLGVVGTLASLLAGFFIDATPSPLDFQVVLGVAIGVGLIAALLLLAHDEPKVTTVRLRLKETFTVPFQNANFRQFMVFAVYWTFSVLTAAPFVFPYFIKYLGMTYTQIAIWTTIASVSGLLFSPWWGRIADRAGNKPVLQMATVFCAVLLPGSWMLAQPGIIFPIWIAAVFDAFVWGAIGPAQFNLALSSAPQNNRSSFIAVMSAVTGLAGFIGGLISGVLFDWFSSLPSGEALGFHWTNYHWLFLFSALLRSQAWRFLQPMQEPGAWRVRDMISRMWS
jgi:MFS family permease